MRCRERGQQKQCTQEKSLHRLTSESLKFAPIAPRSAGNLGSIWRLLYIVIGRGSQIFFVAGTQGRDRIVSYFVCICRMQRVNGQHRQECGPGAQPRAEAPLSQANRETLAGNSDACGPRLKMKLFDIAGGGACSPRLEMKSFDIAGGGACGPRLKM